MNIAVLTIAGAFAIPIVAIICGTIIALAKKNKTAKSNPEELKIIQEVHQSLIRMEKRIESLETILYDQPQKDA